MSDLESILRLTRKQVAILKTIRKGNEDGSAVDLDQIIERLSWHPSKQSFQFSLRKLIDKGLVQKLGLEERRDYFRRTIALTQEGYAILSDRK